jgi:hypothetical protein
MVKRTVLVLGTLGLLIMAVGMSHAQCGAAVGGWLPEACNVKPLYVPVDCCELPQATTIVKKWSAKIEGPCPGVMPACGPSNCDEGIFGRVGLLGGLAAAIPTPFDFLFGGFDGVYGCFGGGLFGGSGGACGPFHGPIPGAFAGAAGAMAAPTSIFGFLW